MKSNAKSTQSKNPQPGDLVEIVMVKNSYKGIFLENPREQGLVLLKLDSGYNIGLNKKDILEINVLKRAEKKEEKTEIKYQKEKPNIAMVVTGGTIVNRYDPKTGAVSPLTSPKDLFRFYPGLFEAANVAKIEIPFMKASEDMDFRAWQKIARTTEKLLNSSEIKGVVIAHGTDTLHYTSAALSFFLKDLNKPVVLTYSQRSSDRPSSDATLNLRCAALAAISDIAEVMLVGHASTNDDFCYAMKGTKVKKLHSSRRDAFKPVNARPIAKVWPDKIEIVSNHKARNDKKKTKLDARFDDKTALIKIYPGQDPSILDYYSKNKYRGLIIEATGLGHVPTKARKSWIAGLKKIIGKGVFVGITTQCTYGRVDPYVYSNLRILNKTGAVFLEDLLAETALVKLGWVLGHREWAKNKETVKEKMLENISGEFNDRLEE